jgi:hypothetical protein
MRHGVRDVAGGIGNVPIQEDWTYSCPERALPFLATGNANAKEVGNMKKIIYSVVALNIVWGSIYRVLETARNIVWGS